MKIGITGSSGFIGNELCEYFLAMGYDVVRMQRTQTQAKNNNEEYFHFDLLQPVFPDFKIDALIHCAVIFKSVKYPDAFEQNINATIKVRDYCRQNNIHFIFLSTMSAHEDSISVYGKHKFEMERKLDISSDTILRLGLVIGSRGGLFNNIRKVIEKGRFIPLVNGGLQPLQTIDVNELCSLMEKIILGKVKGKFTIASPEIVTLKQFYSFIAGAAGKKISFIPVPYSALYIVLKLTELAGINIGAGTENLMGLKQLKSENTKDDLKKLDITLTGTEATIKSLFQVQVQ